MHAGALDPKAPIEAIKSGRTPVGIAPIVTESSSEAIDSSVGVRVELSSAVSLVSASSAPLETRSDPQRSASQEAALLIHSPETSHAASLHLSSKAQRLALIPVDVLDADEIAALREQVEEAERALQLEIERQRATKAEARRPSVAPLSVAPLSVAPPSVTPPSTALPSQAPPSAREAVAPASSMAAAFRSPFESSAPGVTGQSLDIVVGDSSPPSRFPA